MATHDKFIDYLSNKNAQLLEQFVSTCYATKQNLLKTSLHSPKELTRMYDDRYRDIFRLAKDFVLTTQDIFDDLLYVEVFYICLTHFRREKDSVSFIRFYEMILGIMHVDCLKDEILRSFNFYYVLYMYAAWASERTPCGQHVVCEEYVISFEFLSVKEFEWNGKKVANYLRLYVEGALCFDIDAATYSTIADILFEILNHNKETDKEEKEYKKAYLSAKNAIKNAIEKDTSYAVYYYIQAKILFLGLQCGLEEEKIIEDIKEYLNKALSLERTTENGIQKKTQYLSLISEVNNYDTNLKFAGVENNVKEVENKSIKKFSAFSGFITFAFGLFTGLYGKITDGKSLPSAKLVGFIILLFGISVSIYTFMDFVVLGPLANYVTKENNLKLYNESKRYKWKNIVRFIIEIAFAGVGIVLGILLCLGRI